MSLFLFLYRECDSIIYFLNVRVLLMAICGHSVEPVATVHNADGNYNIDRQRRVLEWQLPVINSSNKSGSLECNIPGDDANGFFPVIVSFVSERLICDVDVVEAYNLETETPAQFTKDIFLAADDYTIG